MTDESAPLLLNKKAVLRLTSLAHTTLYDLIKKNQFPRPVQIRGTRRVAWKFSDIQKWVNAQEVSA